MQAEIRSLTTIQRVGTTLYLICAALFAAGVVLQVFFAGAVFLAGLPYLEYHRHLGEGLSMLPVLAFVFGFFTRERKKFVLLAVLWWFLYSLQFMFIWTVSQMGYPALRSLHAVNALVLFWLSLRLGNISRRALHPMSGVRVRTKNRAPVAKVANG